MNGRRKSTPEDAARAIVDLVRSINGSHSRTIGGKRLTSRPVKSGIGDNSTFSGTKDQDAGIDSAQNKNPMRHRGSLIRGGNAGSPVELQIGPTGYVLVSNGSIPTWSSSSSASQGPTGSTGPTGPTGSQGNAGPAGSQGDTGPQGLALTKLYGNGSLVGESGELDIVDGGNVVVTALPSNNKVRVAMPRGITGPTGPAGPLGVQARLLTVTGGNGTLGEMGGSQLVLTATCPGGYLPAYMMYQVAGISTGARFISVQSSVDLATRQISLTLTRDSAAVDAGITTQAICILATT